MLFHIVFSGIFAGLERLAGAASFALPFVLVFLLLVTLSEGFTVYWFVAAGKQAGV
jgi:hypothetical protein